MTHTVTIRHNAEMAHRLPHLEGKCQSIHGHSWWFTVEFAGPVDQDGLVLEFAKAKAALRSWVDEFLDHGLALGDEDPLIPLLGLEYAGKLYLVLDGWPTVERMAQEVGEAMTRWVVLQEYPGVQVVRVEAQETHVNSATWTNPGVRL